MTSSISSVWGTKEHQELVMEVFNHPSTCYFPVDTYWSTHYFLINDSEFDYGLMRADDLEIFTDKVRIAAATYLERNNN